MKKITLLTFFALISFYANSQCIGTFAFPTSTNSINDGSVQTISPYNYAGDYAPINNLTIGEDYEFTSSNPTDYLTLTDASNVVIASGVTPLVVNDITIANVRLHIHTSAACGTQDASRITTIQCTSCTPPPAPDNDDCSSVTPTALVNGAGAVTFTGTTLGATASAQETDVFGGDAYVWEAVTLSASCSNLTIDYCGTIAGNMDNVMIVFTDCLTDYTIGDYEFTTCGDENATITFINLPAGTYYLPVLSDPINNALGDYVMNVSSIDCPESPDCVTGPITPVDGATVPAYDLFTLTWTAPASGPTPTSYDLYVGTLPDGSDLQYFDSSNTTSYSAYVGEENLTLYWSVIALNGTTEATGCSLLWSFVTDSGPTPPVNDNLCDAIALDMNTESAGNAFYDVNATSQAGEVIGSCFNGGINGSVWFTFVAPASGQVTVSTDVAGGTHEDTEVAIYAAPTDCANAATLGAEIGCSQDIGFPNFLSTISATGLTPGATYYIQVDRWGTSDPGYFGVSILDPTLSIDDATQNQFTYFPNPVKNTLQLNAQSNIQHVSIFNMLGQEVLRTSPNHVNSTVDMSALQTGAYFVKVTINDRTETVRVIKQ